MARRRKRRRLNVGRIVGLVVIIAVIVVGAFFITTRLGRTSYASVNKSMGEYMVKANDNLLGKGTDKEFKKSLYVPRKIDKTKKLIAFTFDDGPLKGNTERVIAALEKNDARATFFMLGQNANYYPETVKKVLESGNEVSSHTWNHTYLPKLSAAQVRAKAVFGGGGNNANMPTTVLKAEELTDGGIGILTLMVRCGLSPSNGEARRLVQQGGVSVNDTKITDPKSVIYPEAETILRKGKKVFHKVVVEE